MVDLSFSLCNKDDVETLKGITFMMNNDWPKHADGAVKSLGELTRDEIRNLTKVLEKNTSLVDTCKNMYGNLDLSRAKFNQKLLEEGFLIARRA